MINESQSDEIRVTVIATGFGPARLGAAAARKSPSTSPKEEGQREQPAEAFELSDDVLEVPSFLRD